MHLTLKNCATPQCGIHADFIILRCIKSLLKMLTYYVYAALLRLSRDSPALRATANRLLIAEHLTVKRLDAKSSKFAGFLSVIYYF